MAAKPHAGPPVLKPKQLPERTRQPLRKSSSRSRSSKSQTKSHTWHFEPSPHVNGGLVNAIESVKDRVKKKLWIGVLGIGTDGMDKNMRGEIENKMFVEKESRPVWMPDAEFESCYDEFCHQVGDVIQGIDNLQFSHRFYGQLCTHLYPTPQRPKCSSNRRHSNNIKRSTNGLLML